MQVKQTEIQLQEAKHANMPYAWKSVVTGGGGFIPGIIFHPSVPGLSYLRTDMGGAYRRDPGSSNWVNITDMFGKEDSDYYGVLSIAVDPNKPDTVYMQNGKYTGEEDRKGAFHISNDRGNTWTRVMLPFKNGANEMGRGCGERIAVDPDNGNNIFMGSLKDGLWKSVNAGLNWEKVQSFPHDSVNFVIFDKSVNTPHRRIYAAAADISGSSLYVSNDKGETWNVIAGQPAGFMALRADIGGCGLYAAFSDSAGPYGVKDGAAWKYDTETKTWEKLDLPGKGGGFSGVSVDAKNPARVMISTLNNYTPCDEIYLSEDSGKTWRALLESAQWDSSYAPYAGKIKPHWIADIKIDLFDPEKAVWVTGYGIWSTKNLSGKNVKWIFDNEGIEQSVAMQIVSPPSGAGLYSAMGDIDGFRHDDPDRSPDTRYSPNVFTTLSLAIAWKKPCVMVKAYNSKPPFGAYSADAGKTWNDFGAFPEGAQKGGVKSMAVSADGETIVWAAEGAALSRSTDKGASWEKCGGLEEKILWPLADTQYPKKFYVYDGVKGILYESADSGKNFTVRADNLPKSSSYPGGDGMADYSAAVVPGAEEEVFITAGKGGFYRIMNGHAGAEKIMNVQEAYRAGFGKSSPGSLYPAIYVWAKINNITGFFMSVDEGANWARINDDLHQYGWIHCITGDPKKFGRCYISAEGRGILYGEPVRQG